MRRALAILFAMTTLLAVGSQAMAADSWCYGLPGRNTFPCNSITHVCPSGSPRAGQACTQNSDCGGSTIFCDDFDEYCHPGPIFPGVCDTTISASSDSSLHNGTPWRSSSWNYNTNSKAGSELTIEEIGDILASSPYGARCPQGPSIGTVGQTTVNLDAQISDQIGSSSTNGSDDQPLVLTFTMGCLAQGLQFSNGYMELNLGVAWPADTNGNPDPNKWRYDENQWVTDVNQAPTDYVYVGADNGSGCMNCNSTCPKGYTCVVETNTCSTGSPREGQSCTLDSDCNYVSVDSPWPSICQQEFPNPLCPPLQTFTRHALAVGALAMLDNNPCHCCVLDINGQCTPTDPEAPGGWQNVTNIHLSYFDGLKWRVLKEGMGAGEVPGVHPASTGNFVLGRFPGGAKADTVVLAIRASTVDIYHKAQVNGVWLESWAYDLPRVYTGAFNRLRAGTDVSCKLDYNNYVCDTGFKNGKRLPKVMKETTCAGTTQIGKSKYVSLDNVRLAGGIGNVQIGACCLPNGTCIEEDQNACANQDLGIPHAIGSTCGEVLCCPVPFADTDADGDVDQDDFGAFQVCYTGSTGGVPAGCSCLDRNKDGNVNDLDFTAFDNCFTGANVPWSQSLTPSCQP